MSGSAHEHERLSAFLDDELAPGERAIVAAHLAACAECAARLDELLAVDRAVKGRTPEAPAGYFDALPARVRARLEPRAARRRIPAWTWAAAAALLLAVVTPLTLRRAPEPAARAVPAAAPPAVLTQRAPAPAAPALETEAVPSELKADAGRRDRNLPQPAPTAPARLQSSGFAAAPREEASRQPLPAQAPAAPPPAAAAAPQANVLAREADASRLAGAGAPEPARSQASGALAMAEVAQQPKDEESQAAASGSQEEGRLRAVPESVGIADDTAKSRKLAPGEDDFGRLAATRPQTPAEWRRLREEWRRFVARDPRGTRSDEGRVRAVEAGYQAWRASRDAVDERTWRSDAAAYLARDDAAQKERVRRLVP